MKRSVFFLFCLAGFLQGQAQSFAKDVNPIIGTGGHGHTFPGAVMPFGMVQLSPDTRNDGSWDGCGGYHYTDSVILGFSHTHLSGTGVSDWGDILLMPLNVNAGDQVPDQRSDFDHASEKAEAGFYEVFLKKPEVKARLTVTPRAGIHEYTYKKGSPVVLWIDLLHRDKTLACEIEIIDSVTIAGYRVSEAWAKEQHVYFRARFSKPIRNSKFYSEGKAVTSSDKARREGLVITFDSLNAEPLLVCVGISSTDAQGAEKNLREEAPHFNFGQYLQEATVAWNKQLSKISIEEADQNKRTVFYTALYHSFIHPSLNMDVDRRYRGMDGKIHKADNFTNYSVFSLWDTHRALHPLLTILEPERTLDFINTFLAQFSQSGRLPVWELSSNETNCMIGYHSVSVIADALYKGISNFDKELAYRAMKISAATPAFGLMDFNNKHFLQVEDESESVSKTLEYGYDSWCVARTAAFLGRPNEERLFMKRSMAYINLFDRATGMMRPRRNGGWLKPFYPSEINNHYTEGNSWHYSFYAPHDIEGLISLHGGKSRFEKMLDTLFNTSQKTLGREQADVTGLIGQYAHGNEPSHHMAYLYNYVDKPEKTRAMLKKISTEFYTNAPDGLIGNEDCGQMSAWYVLSSLGFYPVCPGKPEYDLGLPLFASAEIRMEGDKVFRIKASDGNANELTASVNGKVLKGKKLQHADITAGGTLLFTAGSEPEKNQSNKEELRPISYLPAPLIHSASRVFSKKMELRFSSVVPGEQIFFYSTDGTEPTRQSKRYIQPFTIDSNCTIRARAYSKADSSTVTSAGFFKLRHNYKINVLSKLNPQYTAEGAASLSDGIHGDTDWRKGDWLGCQGQDLVLVADLRQKKQVNLVKINCLQDTRSWIVFPAKVDLYVSDDNVRYRLVATNVNTVPMSDYQVKTMQFPLQPTKPVKARYLKIVATGAGRLPEWHMGSGGESFIFADELEFR